jgi:hypothetical protein
VQESLMTLRLAQDLNCTEPPSVDKISSKRVRRKITKDRSKMTNCDKEAIKPSSSCTVSAKPHRRSKRKYRQKLGRPLSSMRVASSASHTPARYGWNKLPKPAPDPAHPIRTQSPAAIVADELSQNKARSMLALSRYTTQASEQAADKNPLSISRKAKDLAGVHKML